MLLCCATPTKVEIKTQNTASALLRLGLTGLCQQASNNKQIMYKMTRRDWGITALKYTNKVGDFFPSWELLRHVLSKLKQ